MMCLRGNLRVPPLKMKIEPNFNCKSLLCIEAASQLISTHPGAAVDAFEMFSVPPNCRREMHYVTTTALCTTNGGREFASPLNSPINGRSAVNKCALVLDCMPEEEVIATLNYNASVNKP